MSYLSHPNQARAMAIAQQDHLQPILATRPATGEQVWFLPSRSDPTRYYLLTSANGTIRCCCPQYQSEGTCAHVAAVDMQHQSSSAAPAEQAALPTSTEQGPPPQKPAQRRQEQEQQYRQEARRREEALLWTDDKPFSIWKS